MLITSSEAGILFFCFWNVQAVAKTNKTSHIVILCYILILKLQCAILQDFFFLELLK